jgi:dienelactone hydrolase
MTTIAIFHSVLGIRRGELDAAARLTSAGHDVLVPDLYDGRVFDDYDTAITWSRGLGDGYLEERALAAVAELHDGFLVAGFSQGSGNAAWPHGVDSQSHQKVDDPFRDPVEEQAAADVAAAGGTLEIFDYPGSGHLFTDPTLPAEYDAEATELMWSRVLPFVAARTPAR